MSRVVISTENAPAAIGPYSQGIVCGDLVFCAGQISLDPATGALIEGELSDEVGQVLENLKAVLQAGGSSIEKVIRLDVYLTDLGLFPDVNDCLSQVFTQEPPARVTVEVSALPLGARVEMAAIATR
jgi:2-iminobutanoate/2-iminopropanoate deaminase